MTRKAAAALPPLASGRRRAWLAAVVANHVLQAALALAAAFAVKALVDGHGAAAGVWPAAVAPAWTAWERVVLLAAVALAMLLLTALLRGLALVQAESLAQHYIAHLRLRLFDAMASLAPEGRLRRSRGATMLRFIGDVQALRLWVGRGIAQCVAAACALTALLAGLLVWRPTLALWLLGWLAVSALLMSRTLPAFGRCVRDSRREQARIAANVFDRIATLEQMQASGAAARERRRLRSQSRRLRRAMQRRAWARARHRWALDLCLAGMALTLLADLVLRSAPQPGLVVAVLGLLALLARPLRGIGRALEAREAARIARERMLEFLNDPARRPRPAGPRDKQPLSATPSLRFAQVAVAGRLAPFSGEVTFGRRVAVCGPAGSGKSTLLALAAGLLDPDGGEVLLDGERVQRIDAVTRQRCIGFVAAEPVLPRGSIRRGLRQRRPDAGDDELLAACALAGWRDADAAALDIRVRDDGANFHAQRRRELALAAALVGDPPLLLIDEPERALPGDPVRCLQRLLQGRRGSVLFSTDDPRLAALADEVWTLPLAAKAAPASEGGGGPADAGAGLRLVRAQ